MAARDGGSEQSRLAAERIARLKRQLDHAERAAETWGAGAEGERRTARRLGELTPRGWFLLHDVHWPGRPLANLDHVLVGPGGVVVVDAKNWAGNVEIRSGILRQNGYSRSLAVEGALGQAAAVAALLEAPHRHLVRSIICTAGQPDFAGTTSSGVEVLGINKVVARVAALPVVLEQQTVVGVYSHLGQQLTQPQAASAPHYGANTTRNPAPRPHHGSVYPPPISARGAGWPAAASGPVASGSRDRALTSRQVTGALWSLLLLGIVVFALTAPLWIR